MATLNLWGTEGEWRERMSRAAKGLQGLECDALLVQEVAQHGDDSNAQHLAEALRMEALTLDTGEAGFGLGILSRTGFDDECSSPLEPAGQGRRWMLSAKPAGLECWLHCTHLSHGRGEGRRREQQVAGLTKVIGGIGSEAVHILGGDMNAVPESDEMRYLRGLTSLEGRRSYFQDAWLRHHAEGPDAVTWCMQRGEGRARRSIDVDLRLDYLYVSERCKDGRGSVLESGRALVPAEGELSPVSDHCALWARVEVG